MSEPEKSEAETEIAAVRAPARSPLRRFAPLVVVVIAAAAVYASGAHRYLSLETIARNRATLQAMVADHAVLAVAVYMLVYIVVVALSLPGGALLTILGGFLFGWLVAGSATVVAATAGAVLIFLAARSSFGDILTRRAGPLARNLAGGFARDAFHYMLFLRLVPVFPFWLVNIAPALFNVSLRRYALATLIGIIPGTFAFAFLGSGLEDIIARQETAHAACVQQHGAAVCPFTLDYRSLLSTQLIIALFLLAGIALVPVIWRRVRGGGDST